MSEPLPVGYSLFHPFLEPSEDVQHLVVDFWLVHAHRDVHLPLRITRLVGLDDPASSSSSLSASSVGGVNPAQVHVLDAHDAPIFDSEAGTYSGRPTQEAFFVHEWRTPTAFCRLVQRVGVPCPRVLHPLSAILDERTSLVQPRRLESLSVNGQLLTGPVALVAGYNAVLGPGAATSKALRNLLPSASQRAGTPVQLDLAAGGGEGVSPGCAAVDVTLTELNGSVPDSQGRLTLSTDSCHFLRQPSALNSLLPRTAALTPATLELGNDCRPCCNCSDYASSYAALRKLWQRASALAILAQQVRDTYAASVARWQVAQACREARVVALQLLAGGPGGAQVQAAYCNTTDVCQHNVALTFHMSTLHDGNVAATPAHVYLTDAATREWTGGAMRRPTGDQLEAFWEQVEPGQSVKVRFYGNYNDDCGNVLTVTAAATAGGVSLGATVTKHMALPCSANLESETGV